MGINVRVPIDLPQALLHMKILMFQVRSYVCILDTIAACTLSSSIQFVHPKKSSWRAGFLRVNRLKNAGYRTQSAIGVSL